VASTDAVVASGARIALVTLSIRWTDRARLAVGAIGVAYALGALAVAQGPGGLTTYGGRSGAAAALEVVVGLSLMVGGLVANSVRLTRGIGDLAVLAGFLWFAPVWEGWLNGPPLVRSLGMVASVATFALVFQLILAYPRGKLRSSADRTLTIAVYVEAALVATGLALFRDPFFDLDCWSNCTDNVFLVRSLPGAARGIVLAHRWFTVGAATALTAVCLWRLATGSATTRRTILPILPPTLMLSGAIWGRAVTLQRTPREDPSDPVFFAIFVIGSVGAILLAVALVWAVVRSRLQRRAVARIVSDLGEVPAPGSLESALARAVGDPELRIAYKLPDSGRFVDASGSTVPEPNAQPGRVLTTFTRHDRRIAVVSHAAALSDLQREIGTAVQLGLENERLQAEVLAHLEELRASRGRVVETGDAERRALERDLHDGAQQGLLALSYDIRIALASAEADGDERTASSLRRALDQAQAGLEELRELAHGIYPAILVEAGLRPALETLADTATLPVEIRGSVDRRYRAAIEAAVYLVAAEGIQDAAGRDATFVAVGAVENDARIVVMVEDDGTERASDLVALSDRVGAVGGDLHVEARRLRGEIPCA
jgi:signal transduction histidine kinase